MRVNVSCSEPKLLLRSRLYKSPAWRLGFKGPIGGPAVIGSLEVSNTGSQSSSWRSRVGMMGVAAVLRSSDQLRFSSPLPHRTIKWLRWRQATCLPDSRARFALCAIAISSSFSLVSWFPWSGPGCRTWPKPGSSIGWPDHHCCWGRSHFAPKFRSSCSRLSAALSSIAETAIG